MKKFVDVDKIEKISYNGTIEYPNKFVHAKVVPTRMLNNFVDRNAEDVIRCRDCRYYQRPTSFLEQTLNPVHRCFYGGYWTPSDFCSKAEK